MTDAPTLDLVAAIVFGISLVALIVWSCSEAGFKGSLGDGWCRRRH